MPDCLERQVTIELENNLLVLLDWIEEHRPEHYAWTGRLEDRARINARKKDNPASVLTIKDLKELITEIEYVKVTCSLGSETEKLRTEAVRLAQRLIKLKWEEVSRLWEEDFEGPPRED